MSLGKVSIAIEAAMSGFESDMGRASRVAEKEFKKIERDAKRTQEQMKEMGKQVGLAIVAGLTVAAVALKSTINSMDAMSKAAQKVGVSTEEFSKLTYAAGLADVSMETLVGSLGKLTKAQGKAMKSTSAQAKVFAALGIDAIDPLTGSLRESTDVLADFADAFKASGGSQELNLAGFALFGKSFQELIPLLKDGSAGIREAGDELEAFGGVLSTEAGQQAEQFNDDLTRLKTAAQSLAQAVVTELLPDLVSLTGGFVDSADHGARVAETAKDIGDALRGAGAIASGVATVFTVVGNGLATIAAQATAVAIILKGEFREGIALYKIASEGFDEALRDATTSRPPADLSKPNAPAATPKPVVLSDFIVERMAIEAERKRRAMAGAIRKALGDPAKAGGGKKSGGGGGKSEEERAADQLQKAYGSLIDRQLERIAMFGKEGEVARVTYDLQHGALKGVTEAQERAAIAHARKLDNMAADAEALKKAIALEDQAIEGAKRQRAAGAAMMAGMQFEIDLLGMSNLERERAIAIRHANVDAMSAEGHAIAAMVEKLETAREAERVMNDIKGAFTDFAVSAASDFDSAGDAFEGLVDRLKRMAIQMLAEKAIQALFGAFFGGGNASGSGNKGSGGPFSLFAGPRALGGPVKKNSLYEVGEGGMPEMLASGGRTFLIPGNDGTVIPSSRGMAASSGSFSGGGGMPNVEVRIMNNGRPVEQEGNSEITIEAGKMIVKLAVGEVTRQAGRRGTPVNSAIRAGLASAGALG